MNLTYRTLLGVAKYMHPVGEPCKGKYLYHDDYKLLNEFVRKNNLPHKTIDAQIMDISDEIAYAAHDLEDTLNQRVFTINEFKKELENELNNNKNLKLCEVTEAIRFMDEELVQKAYKAVGKDYCDQYHTLFTKELGSLIINQLIQDLDAVESESGDLILGFIKLGPLCSAIKKVTFNCLTHTSEIQRYEKKGEIIITDLFNFFFDNTKFMPIEYKDMLKDDAITNSRVVCDYIAGMMDEYATEVHRNIFGSKFFETHGISKSYYFNKGIDNE
jgi:dGTPase